MEAAVPCRLSTKKRPNKSRETDDETKESIEEAHESTRQRLESSPPERIPFVQSLQFGAQICSSAPSDEIFGCESSSGERMDKARDYPSMASGESEEREGGHSGSTKRQKESPFCCTAGHMSPQKCGVELQSAEVQRQSRTPGRQCERRFWLLCSVHDRKSNGCHCKATRMCRTSSRRSVS